MGLGENGTYAVARLKPEGIMLVSLENDHDVRIPRCSEQAMIWLLPEDAERLERKPGPHRISFVTDDKKPRQERLHFIFHNECGVYHRVCKLSIKTLYSYGDIDDVNALPERARSLLLSTA